MKALVTGATGQLGRELCQLLEFQGVAVTGLGRAELDFNNPSRVEEWIAANPADWVINCAAYTQVDRAEEEREKTLVINRDSARSLARGVRSCGGRLVHLSTDYIYDGTHSRPYTEEDQPRPLGVYGQSKLEGEQAVRELLPEAIILRTAWVYGEQGDNFVKTILRLATEREELRVVDDQIGTPTWTRDIAVAIWHLIAAGESGVYHFTNEGVASWYDLAVEIVDAATTLGYPVKTKRVQPIASSDYQTPAVRPAYSVLSKRKIRGILDYDIPHWRESLANMLERMQPA
jgi:dTDP-4-dehydrorhamnose reductase